MRSIDWQTLASPAALALALVAFSCVDSGHLLGEPRSSGGSGGTTGTGGATAVGGVSGTGGAIATGGVSGTGGAIATGGVSGTGGAIAACGGPAGDACPNGEFCDLSSNCGQISQATGHCRPFGQTIVCADQGIPVCGCEGRTYASDCARVAAGMLKASDGVCADNGVSYGSAYLVWQAPDDPAGTGPAVAVSAEGWTRTWDSTGAFAPEMPPPNPTATQTLTRADTDDLFLRLAGTNLTALPHGPATSGPCFPILYFRLCKGCAMNTLKYDMAQQLLPEMQLTWSWFDRIFGAVSWGNPRTFCAI